jgi:hypothetical protein
MAAPYGPHVTPMRSAVNRRVVGSSPTRGVRLPGIVGSPVSSLGELVTELGASEANRHLCETGGVREARPVSVQVALGRRDVTETQGGRVERDLPVVEHLKTYSVRIT